MLPVIFEQMLLLPIRALILYIEILKYGSDIIFLKLALIWYILAATYFPYSENIPNASCFNLFSDMPIWTKLALVKLNCCWL